MGYGVFGKHPSLSKTQACENVELNVSKNCDPLFSLWPPSSFSKGPVDPSVRNRDKNTVLCLIWKKGSENKLGVTALLTVKTLSSSGVVGVVITKELSYCLK